MRFTYSAFGLSFSSNLPISALVPLTSPQRETDVSIDLGGSYPNAIAEGFEELSYASSILNSKSDPALRIWKIGDGSFLRLDYHDGVRFWLDRQGTSIHATWPDSISFEEVTAYLLGPVLGILLRYRGLTCLHASAIAVNRCAVVFVGPEGAGKSTTAAMLVENGCAALSDDIVPLRQGNDDIEVSSAYPHLSLWPDSVQIIYGSQDALPAFVPDYEKRRLSLLGREKAFQVESLPLGKIYLLGTRMNDAKSRTEDLSPSGALLSLVANTYANEILDTQMRADEFRFLGKLVSDTSVAQLFVGECSSGTETLNVIREDLRSTKAPPELPL